MTRNIGLTLIIFFIAVPAAWAQHSDIEFDLIGNKLTVVSGEAATIDGSLVFEADMDTTGLFARMTDDPGFASEDAEGLGNLNVNDIISLQLISSLTHGGFLQHHDGVSLQSGFIGNLDVEGNASDMLNVSESSLTGGSSVVINQVDANGEIHSHVEFALLPDLDPGNAGAPDVGAYAFLAQLTSDNVAVMDSDPFWIVFNYGLDEPTFEGAVTDITGAGIPEPSSLPILLLSAAAIFRRRARKRI